MIAQPRKILIIQFRALGDILLTIPVARKLKSVYPLAHITFMVFPSGAPLLEGISFIDEICVLDVKMGLSSSLSMLLKIYRKKYDLVLDYMNNPRSALFSFLSRAPIRIAKRSIRQFAYTHIVKGRGEKKYVVCEKLEYLKLLGLSYTDYDLDISVSISEKSRKFASSFFSMKNINPDDGPIIALSPTNKRQARQWDERHLIKLADTLAIQKGAQILWLWGPGEYNQINKIQNQLTQNSYIVPKTSLNELAAVLSKCDYFIGTSNGPSHIAKAVGIKTIEIHGPTNPENWTPPHLARCKSVSVEVSCRLCGNASCPHAIKKCMTEITPKMVLDTFNILEASD